jgi:hypothetical protein
MTVNTKYYVLVSDVVGSSQLPDRASLTAKLQGALGAINSEHAEHFVAPLEITRGDEMAAVLRSVCSAYDIMAALEDALYPVRFRSALVFDELTAGLETARSGIIDGPAFYVAHEQMSVLKRTKRTFCLASGQSELDEAAEVLVNLLQWRWNEMTDLQRKIVRLYQKERNQLKVGEMLGRSQQQVSHSLIATKWELINSSEAAIRHLLELIDRKNGTLILEQESATG